MPTPIENNTAALQEILDIAKNLPPAGSQLPELSNPARPNNIQIGYQAIDQDGAVITGAMRLPVGYTELEYIQSDGTQYIDTGFMPNNNTRLVMDIELLSSNGETVPIFGGRDQSGKSKNSFCFWKISETLRSDYGAETKSINVAPIGRHSIDKNKNVTTVDGTSVTHTQVTFQSATSLVLFSNNSLGTIDDRRVHAKLHSCQIYDNGTLIRDFVPCKSLFGAQGLFDLVEQMFYVTETAQSVEFIKEVSVTLKDSQAIDGKNVWNSGIKIRVDGLKAGTTYQIYGGYFGRDYGEIFSGSLITNFDYAYEKAKTHNWTIEDDYLALPQYCFSNGDILDLVIFKI